MADATTGNPQDKLTKQISRWSLDRVQFLLSHIEGFIEDDEDRDLRERAKAFNASDFKGIESLVEIPVDASPTDPRVPQQVLEALSPFFEAGVLLQKSPSAEASHWWGTDLFWRGNTFHLEINDQVRADHLVPEMTPLQVNKAPAHKTLSALKLQFLAQRPDGDAFILRPTPSVAFVLITNLGKPWNEDHLLRAQQLINKCFLY